MLAGLEGFDKDFSKAKAVEAAVGVPVLRHSQKKPSGGCDEILERFNCEAHEVIAVGDRLLSDIVFGNLNRMLTVHVRLT
jgi:phosphatidylglycerophosphatase GEP4